MNKLICSSCEKKIDITKPYYQEEITEWDGDSGGCIENWYHKECYSNNGDNQK